MKFKPEKLVPCSCWSASQPAALCSSCQPDRQRLFYARAGLSNSSTYNQSHEHYICWWSTIFRFSNDSPSQSRPWALSPLRLPSLFLSTMKLEAVVSPDWKRGWSWVLIDRELIGMNVDWRSWIPKKRNVIGLSLWRCQHRMKARPIKGNFCPLTASMIVQVSRI